MNGPGLSPGTRERLEALFAPNERGEATRLLVEACGNDLPSCGHLDPVGLERIRFAALKRSGGSLPRLHEAVRLAQVDWRDLLVFEGFGHDVHAHETWWPEPRRESS